MEASSPRLERMVKLKLAILFHDPPWKPWGIGQEPYTLSGTSGREYWDVILEKTLKEMTDIAGRLKTGGWRSVLEYIGGGIAGNRFEELLKRIGGGKNLGTEDLEAVARALLNVASKYYEKGLEEKLRGCYEAVKKSHAVQGAVILLLVGQALKEVKELEDLGRLLNGAYQVLCGDSADKSVVDRADTLSSAMDRMSVYYAEKALEKKHKKKKPAGAKKPGLKNIFNPELEYSVPGRLSVSQVARFVALYITLVLLALRRAVASASEEFSPQLVYHVMYSFLEPVWYMVVGSPPPADTRVPTHTVFDHLNAALMTSNWLLAGSTPKGCLVLVDLASVHKWLSETRRLRDMWAASWLASWLAWMSVKDYVELYGPDVLVQPPSRLHPFYSSWLLSRICGSRIEDSYCKTLSVLLGLPYFWPLDPTVPSIVSIALPPSECRSALSSILDRYKSAWKMITSWIADILDDLYREVGRVECSREKCSLIASIADAWDSVKPFLVELEPPLPIRIYVHSVEGAWSEALRVSSDLLKNLLERLEKEELDLQSILGREDIAGLLFFHVLVTRRDKISGLRASGRRSGQSYFELAKKLYSSRAYENCSVCGVGVAIIDGEEARKSLRDLKAVDKWRWLLRELGGERLCPYCLAKRLLREYLRAHGERAVGLQMPKSVYERIGRTSIILYTSRTHKAYSVLRDYVEELLSRYKDDTIVASLFVAPQRFLNDVDRKELEEKYGSKGVEEAESIVLEAAHDEAFSERLEKTGIDFRKEFLELLKEIPKNNSVRRVHRRYGILAADGDFMGSCVLAGILLSSSRDYAEKAFNIADSSVRQLAISLYTTLVELVREKTDIEEGDCPKKAQLATLITPSYRFTVSRALSAHAILERHLVEVFEGLLIYAGGDDLTAIVPPVIRSYRKEGFQEHYAGLLLAEASRRLYWGRRLDGDWSEVLRERELGWLLGHIGVYSGFNMTPYSGIVVPALAAYGRSTVLYFVDSKRPLWMVYREASELLDSKGSIEAVKVKSLEQISAKDAFIVASDATGASVFSFTAGSLDVQPVVRGISRLLDKIKDRIVSASIAYDALSYGAEYWALQQRGYSVEARLLVRRLVERNTKSGEEGRVEEDIYGAFRVDPEIYALKVGQGSVLGQLLLLSKGYVFENNSAVFAPPILQLLRAVSITRSAL